MHIMYFTDINPGCETDLEKRSVTLQHAECSSTHHAWPCSEPTLQLYTIARQYASVKPRALRNLVLLLLFTQPYRDS